MTPPPPAGELPDAAQAEGAGRARAGVPSVLAFLRLSRPVFLVGGALLYGLGAAAAAEIDWGRYALGQALVTSVQLATQYANEYFDLDADRAARHRTWLSGGSGVLADGMLAPQVALRAASIMAAAAITLAAVFVVVEPVVAVIGVVALLGGWYYSAPPARLVGSGAGELAASAIVAGLTPLAGALAQRPTVPGELWGPVATLLAAHFAMLLALHIPDIGGDAAAGKRTLAVRIGSGATRVAIVAALAAAAVLAVMAGHPEALLALPPGAALAALLVVRPAAYPLITTAAVATLAALAAGFLAA